MDYLELGWGFLNSRQLVWIAAQLHLNFAAFVLAVPLFALVIEFIGWRSRDPQASNAYDRLAHELTRLLPVAYGFTAIMGALMAFSLFTLFPKVMNYLSGIFAPSMLVYSLLFIAESISLYLYYYLWDRLQGKRKWVHMLLGLSLNLFGTAVMFIANAWASFMMSPAGVTEGGELVNRWQAINNRTWWALNIHRLVANITFGALLCGAYAAYRFLTSRDERERAYYDWMGYTGNFIALFTMLFLPFLGYWLGFEIYRHNPQMGITLMGGFLSWLFVLQAMVIATLFIGTAYYQWMGLARVPGAETYRRIVPLFLVVLIAAFAVWATPRTMVFGPADPPRHTFSVVFGLMAPKMAAVTSVILLLYTSWLFYRRAGKVLVGGGRFLGNLVWAILGVAAVVIIGLSVHGFFAPTAVRIRESVWQILILAGVLGVTFVLDTLALRGAHTVGRIEWGRVPARSQYVLIALAFIIVWLMGVMGYARSAVRTNWHIDGILQDTSPWVWLPGLGGVANTVTIVTLIFFALLAVSFAISVFSAREGEEVPNLRPTPAPAPAEPRPAEGRATLAPQPGGGNG
ncbi:MAG: cytochrome ubiquinol oxidase subunit I [Dehalococcoidia bacterium]